MDINFHSENILFNYRVAAIIEKENKYLVTEYPHENYLSFIGGRVKIGESSIDAITREIKEETGYSVLNATIKGTIENFFEFKFSKQRVHEILILIKIEFEDQTIYDKKIIKCLDKKDVYFTWKSLEELKEEHLEPTCMIDLLNKNTLFHVINKD